MKHTNTDTYLTEIQQRYTERHKQKETETRRLDALRKSRAVDDGDGTKCLTVKRKSTL